jgi:hypothetical protein
LHFRNISTIKLEMNSFMKKSNIQHQGIQTDKTILMRRLDGSYRAVDLHTFDPKYIQGFFKEQYRQLTYGKAKEEFAVIEKIDEIFRTDIEKIEKDMLEIEVFGYDFGHRKEHTEDISDHMFTDYQKYFNNPESLGDEMATKLFDQVQYFRLVKLRRFFQYERKAYIKSLIRMFNPSLVSGIDSDDEMGNL